MKTQFYFSLGKQPSFEIIFLRGNARSSSFYKLTAVGLAKSADLYFPAGMAMLSAYPTCCVFMRSLGLAVPAGGCAIQRGLNSGRSCLKGQFGQFNQVEFLALLVVNVHLKSWSICFKM